MGTRCNIKITDHNDSFWLYRHCDGYPVETGMDLLAVLEPLQGRYFSASDLANDLIRRNLGAEADRREYFPYRLTSGVHGDIEHYYSIWLGENVPGHSAPTITLIHGARPGWAHREGKWTENRALLKTYTLADWRTFCEAEVKAAEARIAAYRTRQEARI